MREFRTEALKLGSQPEATLSVVLCIKPEGFCVLVKSRMNHSGIFLAFMNN